MDRIIGFDQQTLIELVLQLLNTLILTGVLGLILYKPVLKFMKNRSDRIAAQIASAESGMENVRKLQQEYDEKLKNIEKERYQILEEARKQAKDKEERILAEARKDSEAMKLRAESDIEHEHQKIKDDIKGQIIEISTLMASRYISEKIEKSSQEKLLDEAISDLGDAQWLK